MHTKRLSQAKHFSADANQKNKLQPLRRKKMHLWFARKVCLTCPFIHSNYRDSTSGCQTFSGCFAKKLSVMEKGRTPPQQIISSCLFYYFHCFPTFRVTKKEKARREEEIPFGQHLFPCAGKELNGIGMMAVVGQVGSSVSYLYPSTYGPCSSQQAFSPPESHSSWSYRNPVQPTALIQQGKQLKSLLRIHWGGVEIEMRSIWVPYYSLSKKEGLLDVHSEKVRAITFLQLTWIYTNGPWSGRYLWH